MDITPGEWLCLFRAYIYHMVKQGKGGGTYLYHFPTEGSKSINVSITDS